ncbi:MAG: HupE/UreJ family protein [Gemmatimonadaceae bacterium]|nr:HupE/UreJ family protein [Gemmatimonadaceae bacterium]
MLEEFALYLRLGFSHIADLAGYDHLLFITALSIPYAPRDWRRLAILVTAFTVGHSVTLALATLRLVSVSTSLVEALIPATIFVTALLAWREITSTADSAETAVPPLRYLVTAAFGLIHGLGFSSYLRALLGKAESIALPLLSFNVGLEIGQVFVLLLVMTIGALAGRSARARRLWPRLLVGVTATFAVVLLIQRL